MASPPLPIIPTPAAQKGFAKVAGTLRVPSALRPQPQAIRASAPRRVPTAGRFGWAATSRRAGDVCYYRATCGSSRHGIRLTTLAFGFGRYRMARPF